MLWKPCIRTPPAPCPERGIEGALIPMHPGAERYYKEVGVLD